MARTDGSIMSKAQRGTGEEEQSFFSLVCVCVMRYK